MGLYTPNQDRGYLYSSANALDAAHTHTQHTGIDLKIYFHIKKTL